MIQTDILIIGAGPTGLFTVFEAGLLKMRCHIIDALPQAGGQCSLSCGLFSIASITFLAGNCGY